MSWKKPDFSSMGQELGRGMLIMCIHYTSFIRILFRSIVPSQKGMSNTSSLQKLSSFVRNGKINMRLGKGSGIGLISLLKKGFCC